MRRTATSTIIHHHGKPEVATIGHAKVGESYALSQLCKKTVNKRQKIFSPKILQNYSAGVRKILEALIRIWVEKRRTLFCFGRNILIYYSLFPQDDKINSMGSFQHCQALHLFHAAGSLQGLSVLAVIGLTINVSKLQF